MNSLLPSRDVLLTGWAKIVTARPWATIVFCLLLTAASVWITVNRLQFHSDRSELVDPDLPWQQRYAAFKGAFPRWDDAVVVIDRGDTEAERAAAERFINALELRLRQDDRIAAFTAGFPRREAPTGLILTQPLAFIEKTADELGRAGPVFGAPSLEALLNLSQLGGTSLGPAEREGLAELLERIAAFQDLGGHSVLGMEQGRGTERLVSSTGRLATVLVSVKPAESAGLEDSDTAINKLARGIAALREIIAEVRSRDEFAGVPVGVTGVPVLESDETVQSQRDAALAGAVSLGLITLLMLIAYRGFVVPLLAMASLLIGMAWSFAWATIAVGHLQLLSITFASLLLGLGIDVAIHIIARLELVHPDHDHLAPAIAQAFRGVGPGILTASATVAAAAGAMALTPFSGVAEMGMIAAGGMLLCTVAIMCALPAMLMLMPRPERRLRRHAGGESRPFMGGLGIGFHRRPVIVIGVSAACMVFAGWNARGVRYDTDLQKLMPSGTESVRWQNALEADDARTVWHAVVLAKDMHEARDLTERLRKIDAVSDVGGVGMLIQPEEDLRRKQQRLAALPDVSAFLTVGSEAGDAPPSQEQVVALRAAARSISQRWSGKDDRIASAAARIGEAWDDAADTALATYRAERRDILSRVSALRTARPVAPDELPEALKALMVGVDGSLLLRIYPKEGPAGTSVLEPARLRAFASAVLAEAPQATGPAIQIFESTRLITGAYRQAALYSLVAIVILLLIDFGVRPSGILDVVCALLPVGVGLLLMLAVMDLAGVPLNFANMIVMPLIIGIGVGCGVHVVRRWRLQPGDEPPGLAGGSGRAVTLTTLTTVIGFAAMMTGEHRGIWSLGFVMSVGLIAVWIVTILILPSILKLRSHSVAAVQ